MTALEDFYHRLQPVSTGYPLIRLGRASDGGYLVPDCLSGIECCVSPGVCEDFELEENLANCYGIKSVMCDPEHDAPQNLHSSLHFDRLALSSATNLDKRNISMDDLLAKHGLGDSNPLMLSMDIEGAEYKVLPSINNWHRFRIIALEIHFLCLLHLPQESNAREKINGMFNHILTYFDVVHFRPNNHVPFFIGDFTDPISQQPKKLLGYDCIELTLLNKCMRKHYPERIFGSDLPHPLDKRNREEKPEVDYSFYDLLWKRSIHI